MLNLKRGVVMPEKGWINLACFSTKYTWKMAFDDKGNECDWARKWIFWPYFDYRGP